MFNGIVILGWVVIVGVALLLFKIWVSGIGISDE